MIPYENLIKYFCIIFSSILPIGIQSMHNRPLTRGTKRKLEELQAIKTLTPEQATQQLQAFIKKNRIFPSNPFTLEELKALIAQGADVDTKANEKTTALMRASASGNIDAMRILIDAGANVDLQRTSAHENALYCAISYVRLSAIQLLIDAKANPALVFNRAVFRSPNNKIIKKLLDAGADPRTVADHVLEHRATNPVYKETWQLFIEKYPELELTPVQATQELQKWIDSHLLAFAYAHTTLGRLKRLIIFGADVNIKRTEHGIPALICATLCKNSEAVKELLKAGAHINAQTDSYGTTAIMHATMLGSPSLMQLLLEKGADLNIPAKNGKTAIDLAKSEKIPQNIRDILSIQK